MTHDELLKKAQSESADRGGASIAALIAVVELHKPDETDFPDDYENCVECSGNGYVAMYPCHTIKVIEKELSA